MSFSLSSIFLNLRTSSLVKIQEQLEINLQILEARQSDYLQLPLLEENAKAHQWEI